MGRSFVQLSLEERRIIARMHDGDRDMHASQEASSFRWNALFATDLTSSIPEANSVTGKRI